MHHGKCHRRDFPQHRTALRCGAYRAELFHFLLYSRPAFFRASYGTSDWDYFAGAHHQGKILGVVKILRWDDFRMNL
jgi:hypothetical protein